MMKGGRYLENMPLERQTTVYIYHYNTAKGVDTWFYSVYSSIEAEEQSLKKNSSTQI